MRVLLLTGPGGDAQGWGAMDVTNGMAAAIAASGDIPDIAWVETESDFLARLDHGGFDIVWSALYQASANDKYIGTREDALWVADVFDQRGIPYVGSPSAVMKSMIDKFRTHDVLAARGVSVPAHRLVRADAFDVEGVRYPAFVKPLGESRSIGVNDDSVVDDERALRRQVEWIAREFRQPALVEDFLPGDEFTVLLVGNGTTQQCLPGLVSVASHLYGRHKVLRADLRGVGLTKISDPGERGAAASALAAEAAVAMGCLDHVRIDVKTDADGHLRVMEVNGIPGMKPGKSWGPQLYTLHHRSPDGELEDYRRLVKAVVDAAAERFNVVRR